jgi:cytoskeleton protein RodZ
MTLKTARTKLRLTEIESLTQTGRTRTREAAN